MKSASHSLFFRLEMAIIIILNVVVVAIPIPFKVEVAILIYIGRGGGHHSQSLYTQRKHDNVSRSMRAIPISSSWRWQSSSF